MVNTILVNKRDQNRKNEDRTADLLGIKTYATAGDIKGSASREMSRPILTGLRTSVTDLYTRLRC